MNHRPHMFAQADRLSRANALGGVNHLHSGRLSRIHDVTFVLRRRRRNAISM